MFKNIKDAMEYVYTENAIINTIEEKRLSQLKEENEKYRNSYWSWLYLKIVNNTVQKLIIKFQKYCILDLVGKDHI